MKKIILSIALLSAISTARAEFYVGAGYGLSVNQGSVREGNVTSEYKDSSIYALEGGIVMPLPLFDLRAEVEYFHTRPETKSVGKKHLDALIFNTTGVIPLIPFVGMGWGYGRYEHNNTSLWQALAGVEYAFETNPFTIGAEYRFLKLTEHGGKGSNSSKFYTHGLMLKLKYTF